MGLILEERLPGANQRSLHPKHPEAIPLLDII
jgi:hypothetical protein